MRFPFICSNIPTAPTYGVYLFRLVRYSSGYGSYQDFLDRVLLLTRKLLNKVAILVMFKSSLREFYGRRYCLDNRYGISVINDHVVYTFFLFLLVILFSVCRFTHSDYPFGIFKLFLSVLRFTNPDYPFGMFELSFLSICRY